MKNELFKLVNKRLLVLLIIVLTVNIVVAYISCNERSVDSSKIDEYIELYQNHYSVFEEKFNNYTDFSSDAYEITDNNEYDCLITVNEISNYIEQYKNDIQSVLFQTEVNLSEGVPDTYSYRYQNQVKQTYEGGAQNELPMIYVSGWTSYFSNYQQCLFMLMAVIILSSFAVINDYDVGMNALIQTTKKGKIDVLYRKIAVTSLLIVSITVVISIITLVTIAIKEGLSGGNAPLQLIPLFEYCPCHISILEYAVIQMLIRMCVFVAIGFFSILISLLFKSYFATTISIILITVMNRVIASAQLQSNSFTALFNGWLSMDTNALFSKLECCNLFGYPTYLFPGIIFPIVIGMLLCVFLSINYQNHFTSGDRKSNIRQVTQWLERTLSSRTSRRFPVQFELKKIFNGLLIIVFCISAVCMKCYITINSIPERNDDIYRMYTEELYGELTLEKESQISNIRSQIEGVLASKQSIVDQYKSGEISDAEYRQYMTEYWNNYVLGEEFGKVEAYAADLAKSDNNGWIIYDTGYNLFFDLKPDLILCGILFILSCGVFCNEKKLKMNQLNNTTTKGKNWLFRKKIKTSVMMAFFVSVVFIFIDIIIVAKQYSISSLNAPIQSLRIFADFQLDITIGQFLILFVILKILFYTGFSILVSLLGIKVTSNITMITLTLVAVLIPDYISVYIPAFRYLDALNYFSVTEIVKLIGGNTVLLVGVPCIYGLLTVTATLLGKKQFIAVEE